MNIKKTKDFTQKDLWQMWGFGLVSGIIGQIIYDVKEAVLEFRKTLTEYAKDSYMEDEETLRLRKIFDKIFGDWKNES